ncbi:hypothetical protein V8F20_004931 [Naviculisporaceae sp. PSN 640]
MYAPAIFVSLLAAATTSLAAPTASSSSSSSLSNRADAITTWTITSFERTCSPDNTYCTITFGIDDDGSNSGRCQINISRPGGLASQASYNNQTCGGKGSYTVGSSWSGQFGADKGFTTLSVVDTVNMLIVWPAYSDAEVKNGQYVVPDKSYQPIPLV